MTKRFTYSREQSLILDSRFMEIFPLDLSMKDRTTLESLTKIYYSFLKGPDGIRIPLKDCSNERLFCAVQNFYKEAEKRLKQYKEDLSLALSEWNSLTGNEISILQQIAIEKRRQDFSDSYLYERLCIQLEDSPLPLKIGINGKFHPYPLFLLYQQL